MSSFRDEHIGSRAGQGTGETITRYRRHYDSGRIEVRETYSRLNDGNAYDRLVDVAQPAQESLTTSTGQTSYIYDTSVTTTTPYGPLRTQWSEPKTIRKGKTIPPVVNNRQARRARAAQARRAR